MSTMNVPPSYGVPSGPLTIPFQCVISSPTNEADTAYEESLSACDFWKSSNSLVIRRLPYIFSVIISPKLINQVIHR